MTEDKTELFADIKKIECTKCNKGFKSAEALEMHNRAKHPELIPKKKKSLPIKKIRNWGILILIIGLFIWGGVSLINNENKTVINEDELNFEVPKGEIHWHPHLTIKIDGNSIRIPTNIGMAGNVHHPIHTHETDGTIHMENGMPTKKNVVLGYFFEVWGKRFSKDCIFEYCTDKGTLKMYVNDKENLEFENYFMQDKDRILIEFNSSSTRQPS